MDYDVVDKLMILEQVNFRLRFLAAYKRALLMEVESEKDKQALSEAFEAEAARRAVTGDVPRFLAWLFDDLKLPSCLTQGARERAMPRHHPELFFVPEKLPQHILLNFIARALFAGRRSSWSGSATDLEGILRGDDSVLTRDERWRVPQSSWLGRCLEKLAEQFPWRFVLKRTADKRIWTIHKAD